MRIIAGSKKGIRLVSPPRETRPTQEKVRGAIFNVLGGVVDNTVVLDLFCGSGALGLEALSRGARVVTFIDKSTQALRTNVAKLAVSEQVFVIKGDVFRQVKYLTPGFFDLVFLDPPYQKHLVNRAIISVLDLLTKTGIIVVEHHKKEMIAVHAGFCIFKEKKYGDTRISFIFKGNS